MRQIIAIDCDDVLTDTSRRLVDHYNATYHTSLALKDVYSTDPTLWGVTTDPEEGIRRVQRYLMSTEFQDYPPFEAAINVVRRLASYHELHVVTGRPDALKDATLAMIRRYFDGCFSSVTFTNRLRSNARTKAEVCHTLNATLLIDDYLFEATTAAKQGIAVDLFGDYAWNQTATLPQGVQRAKDWPTIIGRLAPDTAA